MRECHKCVSLTVLCVCVCVCSYIKDGKTSDQLVINNSDATSTIMNSLSEDICSAKLIALVNQPEVVTKDNNKHVIHLLKRTPLKDS